MSVLTANEVYDALIVDDEPGLRQAMARAFTRSGFRCGLAADGLQARTLLAERQYDLVVTDLRMPEMNGHQLVVELLERDDRPVVIVVTGVTEPKIERDLRSRGVDELLFKPVDYVDLVQRGLKHVKSRAECIATFAPREVLITSPPSEADTDRISPVSSPPSSTVREPGTTSAELWTVDATANASDVSFDPIGERQRIGNESTEYDVCARLNHLESAYSALVLESHRGWFEGVAVFAGGILVGWLLATFSR